MLCVNQVQVVNPKSNKYISVPCGTCYACQSNRRSSWMFRNSVEFHFSTSAFFVTLTYDDVSLSKLPVHMSSGLRMPLKYQYQRWLKRMRKSLGDVKLRYFLCHEYGDLTARPHYHALLYLDTEMSLTDMRSLLRSTWSYGNIQCDYVTQARIHYLTKYVTKQFRNIKTKGRTVDYIFSTQWDNKELQDKYIYNYFLKKYSFISASNGLGCQLLAEPTFVRWFWEHLKPGESYPTYSIGGHNYTLPRIYLSKLIPDIWRDDIAPDISPIAKFERLMELSVEANLSPKQYVSNAKYIQHVKSKAISDNNICNSNF